MELLKVFVNIKPKIIMEIGSERGGTLFCFTKLAPDDATIISVDLPCEGIAGKEEYKNAFAKPNQDFHLIKADSHAKTTFKQVESILHGRMIDFLFIDGDHTYEGVKRDFEMYGPLAKIVGFHDITHVPPLKPRPSRDCFVDVFWQETKNKYPSREFVYTGKALGIGILYRSLIPLQKET